MIQEIDKVLYHSTMYIQTAITVNVYVIQMYVGLSLDRIYIFRENGVSNKNVKEGLGEIFKV